MERKVAVLGIISLVAGTCAFAQSNGSGEKPAGQGSQTPQSGTESQSMGRAADAGNARPASGTLMQQREKGMSPQGESGTNATGKMKQ
jgi:hypothetical protein